MAKTRKAKGADVTKQLFGGPLPQGGPMTADFMELTNDYLFGELWTRPGMTIKDRSRATCTVLAAFGCEPQLKGHVKGALNLGIKPAELKELFIHVAHYAGWSTGVIALKVLDEAVEERKAAQKAAKPKAAAKKAPAKKTAAKTPRKR